MSEIADARINTFGISSPKADFVPPAEQLITLTYAQLSDLIALTIEKAIQPLQDEVSQLQATIDRQAEKIAALESTQDTQADNQLIQLRLINDLRESTRKDPQPLQKDRAEILRALLVANGGKMLAKDARHKMHLRKELFSMLLASMNNEIEIRSLRSDKRIKVLSLKQ